MRILLVSQSYPPDPAVGSLRAQKVARALRTRGHHVIVLAARLRGEGDGLRVDEPGLQVHTVSIGDSYPRRLLGALARYRRRSRSEDAAPPTGAPGVDERPDGRFGWLRRLVVALLSVPDVEQHFIWPATRAAKRLVRGGVDLVYTTSPPHSTHLVGLLVASSAGVPWVMELRDPWTDQRVDETHPERVELVERLHRWLERRCLQRASRVVAVTGSAAERLRQKLPPAERSKVVLALNGIECLAPREESRRGRPFRCIYAGSLDAHIRRDPRPFLEAVARLRCQRSLTHEDIQVEFIGDCRVFDGMSMERFAEEQGLGEIVRFTDWLPHHEVRARLREADLVLLIARLQPLQVPNKLFDYLGARVPVLGIVDAGGETERMLRAVGGQYVVSVPPGGDVSVDDVLPPLERALDDASHAGPADAPKEEVLREWLTARQMEHLAEAIEA